MILFILFLSQCFHDLVQKDISVNYSQENLETDEIKQPIRIHFEKSFLNEKDTEQCFNTSQTISPFYSSNPIKCESYDILSDDQIQLLNQTLTDLETHISSLLKVNRLLHPLQPKKTLDFPVIDSEIEADLLIYVSIRPFSDELNNSNAISVFTEANRNRVLTGAIVIRPSFIPIKTSNSQENTDFEVLSKALFDELLHQVFHIFGLSHEFIHRWDNNAKVSNDSIQKYNSKSFAILHSTHVNQFAIEKFGQQSFDQNGVQYGIELESMESFHTSSRVFYSDIMNAYDFGKRVLSGATLAMLSDIGPYEVDFVKSEELYWGSSQFLSLDKNIGSSSGGKMSFQFDSPQLVFPSNYLCTDNDEDPNDPVNDKYNKCSYDLKSKAKCSNRIEQINCDLPENSQKEYCLHKFFYNPNNYSLVSEYSDYQNYKIFSGYTCSDLKSKTAMSDRRKEQFSSNSYCAEGVDNNTQFSGCYPMFCDSLGLLEIQIGSVPHICLKEGQQIEIRNGIYITCPSKQQICNIAEKNDYWARLFVVAETILLFGLLFLIAIIAFITYCCIIKERKRNDEKTVDIPLIV